MLRNHINNVKFEIKGFSRKESSKEADKNNAKMLDVLNKVTYPTTSLNKLRPPQIRLQKVGAPQISPAEIRTGKAGPAKTQPLQISTTKIPLPSRVAPEHVFCAEPGHGSEQVSQG